MVGVGYVGIVRTTLMADTAQFDSAMMGASRTFKRAAHDIRREAQSLFSMSAGLNLAVTLPIAMATRSIIKTGAEFDAAMMKMRQTAKISSHEFSKLADSMMQVSRAMRIRPSELAATGYQAAQAQITNPRAIKAFQEALAKGQKTHPGDAKSEDVSSGFIANINAFKFAHKDFNRVMAEMDKTIVLGRQSWKEYANTISQVAAVAASVPVGDKFERFANMNIALALATQGGVHPSQASTALRNIYLRIYKRSEVGHSELNKVAQSMGYKNAARLFEEGAGGDPTAFMQMLARRVNFRKLQRQTAYNNPETMTGAGFMQREISTALQLANASPAEVRRYREEYGTSVQDFEAKYKEALERPFAILEGIAATAERVKVKFFQSVEKPVALMLKGVERFIRVFEDMPRFQKQAISFTAMLAALVIVIRTIYGFISMLSVGRAINKIVSGQPLGSFEKGVLARIKGLQKTFSLEEQEDKVATKAATKRDSAARTLKLNDGPLRGSLNNLTVAIRDLTMLLRSISAAMGIRTRGRMGGAGVAGKAAPFYPYGLLGTPPKQLGYTTIGGYLGEGRYKKVPPSRVNQFTGRFTSAGFISSSGQLIPTPLRHNAGYIDTVTGRRVGAQRVLGTVVDPGVRFTMPGYRGPTTSGRAHSGPFPGVHPDNMGRRVYPLTRTGQGAQGFAFARDITPAVNVGPAAYNHPMGLGARMGQGARGAWAFMNKPIGTLGMGKLFSGMDGIGQAIAWSIKWVGVMAVITRVVKETVNVLEISFLPALNSMLGMFNQKGFSDMMEVLSSLSKWVSVGLQLLISSVVGAFQNLFGILIGTVMLAYAQLKVMAAGLFMDLIDWIRNSWLGRRFGWEQTDAEKAAAKDRRQSILGMYRADRQNWGEYHRGQVYGLFGGKDSAVAANARSLGERFAGTTPIEFGDKYLTKHQLTLRRLEDVRKVINMPFVIMEGIVNAIDTGLEMFFDLAAKYEKWDLVNTITKMLGWMETPEGILTVGGSAGYYEAGTVAGYEAIVQSNNSLLKGIQDLRIESVDMLKKILEELEKSDNSVTVADILRQYNITPEMTNLWGRL